MSFHLRKSNPSTDRARAARSARCSAEIYEMGIEILKQNVINDIKYKI